jgi:nitronate monooxygenase
MQTPFSRRLGIELPLIQGPMNGVSSVDLAVAVCEAGALGSLAAAILSPAAMREQIAQIRSRTSRPFAVNLFVLGATEADEGQVRQAREWLAPFWRELGVPEELPAQWGQDFPAQFETLVEAAPPVASFTFGILSAQQVERLHACGTVVVGTATTLAEGRAWATLGADAVCAQATEAGGHRGTFLVPFDDALIGGFALYRQMAVALDIPVIAAGGIMDGQGIAAALTLGAQAAQLGTAFIPCPEAVAPAVWKQALTGAGHDTTRLTRAFSGRPARGIVNAFMQALQPHEAELPPYPVQNALTTPLRRAAAKANRADLLALYAGQGAALARVLPAAELVRVLAVETAAALRAGAALLD